ncbi:hypothetical protein L3Q82_022165, partial [Scortum barcoo]
MAAELGSYKQDHTSPPPLTLGNSRVVEGPAPLKELGSRAQAMRGGLGHRGPGPQLLPKPHCTGPSWIFLRVVSLLEGGPTSLFQAEPGWVPWAKTRQSPGAQACEPQPQAWLQGGAPCNANPGDTRLRRAISSAKRQYRDKVESHYKGSNTRSMWAGLKTLTDYKKKISSAEVMSASLPDELNTFYARFESTSPAVEVQKAQEDHCPPVISRADVCRTLKQINTRKAPGPDGIPGRALKVCADQLADVFADIFNVSLLQSVVPTCFKETIIVPVPKKTKILSLNDYRPVALTSTIMKCFERLVKSFITSSIPDSLDPLQFAYRPNRSTEDAIALTLHTALSHLDQRDTYVRMLFIDYSSAFNTIVPSKLVTKLRRGTRPPLHQRDYGGESQQLQPDSGSSSSAGCGRLNMDSRILYRFYRCTTESILTGCITAWYSSCTALN